MRCMSSVFFRIIKAKGRHISRAAKGCPCKLLSLSLYSADLFGPGLVSYPNLPRSARAAL